MRGLLFGGVLILLLSGFVVASSEITMEFTMNVPEKEVKNYVPSEYAGDEKSFTYAVLGFAVLLAVLIGVYFVFLGKKKVKKKKVSRKKVSGGRVSKKKISSKKKSSRKK